MRRADLDRLRDDEEWAARLSRRLDGLVPDVPADIPAVMRRGRRRRAVRGAAGGAVAVVAVAAAVAVPILVQRASDRPAGLDAAAPEVVGFVRSIEVVDGDEQEHARAEDELVLEQVRVLHELEAELVLRTAAAEDAEVAAAQAEAEAERAEAHARNAALRAEEALEALEAQEAQEAALRAEEAQKAALRAMEESVRQRALLEQAQAQLEQAQAQLDQARWVVDAYGLQEFPEVTPVEVIPAAHWADRLTWCLRERGDWDVVTIPGGWWATYDPTEEEAFGADLYACAVMYPVDPQ